MSSSVGQGNWNQMLQFVINIVNGLRIGAQDTHVGIVTYSDQASVEIPLNEYFNKADLVTSIETLAYLGGNTNTAAGLRVMMENAFDPTRNGLRGDRPGVRNLAMIITDGESNINEADTIPNANRAKNAGIILMAMGITNAVNVDELRRISNNGIEGQTYWLSPSFTVARDIVDSIVEQACSIIEEGYIYIKKIHTFIFIYLHCRKQVKVNRFDTLHNNLLSIWSRNHTLPDICFYY